MIVPLLCFVSTLEIKYTFRETWLKPGETLVLGMDDEHLPSGIPAPEGFVFLVGPGLRKVIERPEDLTGLVSITSGRQALQFVRLLTCPEWINASPSTTLEVCGCSEVDLNSVCGNTRVLDMYRSLDHPDGKGWSAEGFCGILSTKTARKIGSAPRLWTKNGEFFVSRLMMQLTDGQRKPEVFRVVEEVAPNGKYKVVSKKKWNDPIGLNLMFPMYL